MNFSKAPHQFLNKGQDNLLYFSLKVIPNFDSMQIIFFTHMIIQVIYLKKKFQNCPCIRKDTLLFALLILTVQD